MTNFTTLAYYSTQMHSLRKPVPDLMKGIAVVAMIQVHIMELFARPEIFDGVPGKISLFIGGPFAAPVFMAVMGYFIVTALKGRREKVKRGIMLILLGLLLNIGLNLHLLIKIYKGTFDLNPWEYIFGADILFLAGISIIIITLLERMFPKRLAPFILLAILVPLISSYLPDLPPGWKYLQGFFYGHYSWSYFPIFPWLAYPLLGYIVKRIETEYPDGWFRIKQRISLLIIVSAILIISLFVPAFKRITELPSYYHHQIFLFTWITGFLMAFTWLIHKLESFSGQYHVLKYLKWLGKNVTIVYVAQWLIIGNIATAIYKTQDILALLMWFLAILAVVTMIVYLYVKMKNKGTVTGHIQRN
jgi:uncharacterized membrane protein